MILTRAARALQRRDANSADNETSETLPSNKKKKTQTEDEDDVYDAMMKAVFASHAAISAQWTTVKIDPPVPMPDILGSILAQKYYHKHMPLDCEMAFFGESHALTDPATCGAIINEASILGPSEVVLSFLRKQGIFEGHFGHVSLVSVVFPPTWCIVPHILLSHK